ncbi:histidine-rich glycoprotein-like [Hyla sarda]|uniref:histidine-rich glycoprotein-like n=1 Tax=Hyla sarda TaxID=327740 RepID=UPI0024C42F50|nr:histidine-rich glycoprotein-like [Hyla sarda]
MKRIVIVALLVALCSATSPTLPIVHPLHCNETLVQTELAIDLINKERDEGFVFRPLRIESVFMQESGKLPGGIIYYLDLDVLETDCSVVSRKSWKECQNDIPLHETVFGHCKAIIFIAKPWRILKLMNYNCTLSTVPPRSVVQMCPDCPTLIKDITPNIKAKADLLIEQHNKDSNHTHYFKVDKIERVRTQYVFGQSYFFLFTIKESECLKTQANVNLADCKFLKDHEAEVGFCTGSSYNTPADKEAYQVTCEIYPPLDDDDDNHGQRQCHHGPDSSQDAPGADAEEVKQEGAGEAGQDKNAPGKHEHHKHGHHPHRRGHKHHHCRHHDHPPHHHHHHHHHGNQNDSHPHHHGHHHHHHHHNHTSDDSSSEENSDNKSHKPFEKSSKGSVQFYDLPDEQSKVPVPTIVRLPPPPEHPGKYGKHGKHGKFGKHGTPDTIEFPSEHSTLNTCPGVPLVDVQDKIKNHIF